tara:strand:- start:57 stop:266 length:210 start_codon:yes stop_codon:yes gene_type:complete
MATKFDNPEVKTYLAIWNEGKAKLISYAEVNTNERFTSKYSDIDYYTDRSEWKTILVNNGIDPDEGALD